ncbi:LOW QUALITY PROTEIN: Uncharacterized protein PHPALM_28210 [Phytophthora palmivora]|uniref:Uncharacterized protein n=1 Tax=Phytophthora palmivora TaxID=4796 RepID=A0A2P4XAM7_9STRA|nr:LOW QUALITY PROTEIN: Uncharacterized protein PHPALM_28210 [Phytophthora palmivora]
MVGKGPKKVKVRECYICESTDRLRADCPERGKVQSGGGAKADEQKRNPRGNLTIWQNDYRSLSPDHDDDDVGGENAGRDGVGADASSEDRDVVSGDELQEVDNVNEVNDESNDTNGGWWYFDTAANVHITGNRSYYVAFTETLHSQIVFKA